MLALVMDGAFTGSVKMICNDSLEFDFADALAGTDTLALKRDILRAGDGANTVERSTRDSSGSRKNRGKTP
jgi:hypothetical protein